MSFQWIACLGDAEDLAAAPLQVLSQLGYHALLCAVRPDEVDTWIARATSASLRAQLAVWPCMDDNMLSATSPIDREALLRAVASWSGNISAAVLIVSGRPANELGALLEHWRESAVSLGIRIRVIVTRQTYQATPENAERLDWVDLVAGTTQVLPASMRCGQYKSALRWVVERLDMQRQHPGLCHSSIYLPSLVDSGATSGAAPRLVRPADSQMVADDELQLGPEIVNYWADEAAIIARNNRMRPERLLFVRGDPFALRVTDRQNHVVVTQNTPDDGETPRQESATGVRVAVVLHLHYPQLWPEFALALTNIVDPFDLYVTTSIGLGESVRAIVQSRFAGVRVLEIPNRGRDVLPFFRVHMEFDLARYQFICKIHSKQSLHVSRGDVLPIAVADGNHWRHLVLDSLLGSTEQIAGVWKKFEDPTVGMVCPQELIVAPQTGTIGSLSMLHDRIDRLKLRWPETAFFAAGTMFWVRVEAIRPLLEIPVADGDFEGERGQLDYTLHHALERLFGIVVHARGFRLDTTPSRTIA